MASIFVDNKASTSPPLRPKFSLGGQVCRYSSNPQIGSPADEDLDKNPGLILENHNGQPPSKLASAELIMSNPVSRSTPRSLNPELLMREFTQDEQGRIDSLGATDSPSACFQSQFAREVVQNSRRSSHSRTSARHHSYNFVQILACQ